MLLCFSFSLLFHRALDSDYIIYWVANFFMFFVLDDHIRELLRDQILKRFWVFVMEDNARALN